MICINPEIIDVTPTIEMDLGRKVGGSPFKPQGLSMRSSAALQADSKQQGRAELHTRLSCTPGARHWDLSTSTQCASTNLHTLCTATGSELGRARASQYRAWTQVQHRDSSTHLYPVIFHVLHTGHTDEGRSPPVHCLQLHVHQEAVGWALGPRRTQVNREHSHALASCGSSAASPAACTLEAQLPALT